MQLGGIRQIPAIAQGLTPCKGGIEPAFTFSKTQYLTMKAILRYLENYTLFRAVIIQFTNFIRPAAHKIA